MAFPTSGYTASHVNYVIACEGNIDFQFTLTVEVANNGASVSEEIMDALDAWLVTAPTALGGVTGVTDTRVYKSITGGIGYGDIA